MDSTPSNPSDDQSSTSETATPVEDKPKPPPKPTVTPPYILPTEYPSSTPAPTIPSHLPPSTTLPFPHILGFLNTPIRLRRFLTRRYQAEETGALVASFLLASSTRPFSQSDLLSSSQNDSDLLATTAAGAGESKAEWEQQILLEHEENQWHKSARAPNKPDELNKERPWQEPMVIDPRVGSRMRTTLDVPVSIPDPDTASDSLSSNQDSNYGGRLEDRPPPTNAIDWRGGVIRPERVTWGEWFQDFIGMETKKVTTKGWEQGDVGDENS